MIRLKKIRLWLTAMCMIMIAGTVLGNGRDSVFRYAPTPLTTTQTNLKGEIGQYLHFGFRLGTDFTLSKRQVSNTDKLVNFTSATFGFYVRGGYRFIFGELGLHYMFYKGFYRITDDTQTNILAEEQVESRYLQIPFKVVGYWEATPNFALVPQVGITYQPLIHVSKNDINYNKKTLTPHQFLYSAGLGFKIKFVTLEVSYKKAIKPFFKDRDSEKQSFLNLMIGVQF